MEKKPRKVCIEGQGWLEATKESPIEIIWENGEMGVVRWFRQGNRDYNGRFVVLIEYF